MSLPQTHPHPNPLRTLAPHLLPHLPHSLPLLRRLQFHHSSPSARTIATFPPHPSHPPPHHFTATYVDRTRTPETECWIFSTYASTPSHHDSITTSTEQHDPSSEAQSHILALVQAISHLPSPASNTLLILGALPDPLLPVLSGGAALEPQPVISRRIPENRNAYASPNCVLTGISVPYMKWLIAPPPSAVGDEKLGCLPRGYRFDAVKRDELARVISRTSIPKTEETLVKLGSVGIRYHCPKPTNTTPPAVEEGEQQGSSSGEGELIAWAFISVDGSLSTLHVEPAHRGQGLAKAVSKRLVAELARDPVEMGFWPVDYGESNEVRDGGGELGMMGWAHSDVAVDNKESAGVVRGLGGKEGWVVRWVGVDLGRVEGAVRGLGMKGEKMRG